MSTKCSCPDAIAIQKYKILIFMNYFFFLGAGIGNEQCKHTVTDTDGLYSWLMWTMDRAKVESKKEGPGIDYKLNGNLTSTWN